MFVLPPPPRYPSGTPGTNTSLLENNNILKHPTGTEYQLSVGEGTYVLHDDLHLATPPPHPSEAPALNPNPLATTVGLPTAGTKLSLVSLSPRHTSGNLYRYSLSNSHGSVGHHDAGSASDEHASSSPRKSNGTDLAYTPTSTPAPVFGEGSMALSMVNGKESKDPSKKRKPKNNIIKSNSSFVSRVIPHEGLNKLLQENSGYFAFANINRAFHWLDLSSEQMDEPLTKILFTKAHALCHDVNSLTKSPSHIDIVMGFSTSDLIWYEPMSQKYARINKNGSINASAVAEVCWVPNSEGLFLAAHMDGTLVVYDKEREDAPFVPEEAAAPVGTTGGTTKNGHGPTLKVHKSVQSRTQKFNPVAVYKLSSHRISSVAFSPDSRHLAVVTENGTLRILDFLRERLLDVYPSYYGGMLCVCWSPDGRYVVTGGQDDLVSIWSLEDRGLVARCQGHHSWVTGVSFDEWRCDGRNYRFGSVGEDCRLLLWDFNVSMLHRPRAASVRQIGRGGDATRIRSNSTLSARTQTQGGEAEAGADEVAHAVEPRGRTAMLPPVMSKQVDDHPMAWLGFEEDFIITSCKEGHIRTWDRPKEGTPSTADSSA